VLDLIAMLPPVEVLLTAGIGAASVAMVATLADLLTQHKSDRG